jgi:hypothetical protein
MSPALRFVIDEDFDNDILRGAHSPPGRDGLFPP